MSETRSRGVWVDVQLSFVQSGSFDRFSLEKLALGGGGLPIFGTAGQVAEKLARLYRDGIDGVLLTFLEFYQDTIRFEREIKPLLGQLGVPLTGIV
jgi:alkanesulfonate monooxygenase SsuD/methylene tetrahydromethanopterin reductase-like flavin-dependent oxidoreductase (luciferase family)